MLKKEKTRVVLFLSAQDLIRWNEGRNIGFKKYTKTLLSALQGIMAE